MCVRFFSLLGGPKNAQCSSTVDTSCQKANGGNMQACQVNTSALDAVKPAVASYQDDNGFDVVFVAWEETVSSTNSRVLISRYDGGSGALALGPVRVENTSLTAVRHDVALAIDTAGTVIVAWSEKAGSAAETIVRRRLTSFFSPLESPTTINSPPAAPAGAKRALQPKIATDASNNFLIAWQGNVNDPNPTPTAWSGFAKSFGAAPTPLKSDFRLDLAGRADVQAPRVARSSQAKKFAYTWRDKRSGRYDVYTRAVPSLP